MVVKTDSYIYVMEFKLHGTAEEAMVQIRDKGYPLPFVKESQELILIGAALSDEKRRKEVGVKAREWVAGGQGGLIRVFKNEDALYRFAEKFADFKSKGSGGEKPVFLNGYNGLSADSYRLRKLLLSYIQLGSFNFNSILHRWLSFYTGVFPNGIYKRK